MSPRRSSKEPQLEPGSPLAPIVESLKTMARGLAASSMPEADGEALAFVRGKIEGLESAITLLQRAGAVDLVTPEGQRLVKIAPPNLVEEDASLRERVERLEKQVRGIRVHAVAAEPRAVPAILEAPRVRVRPKDGALGRCERKLLEVLAQRRGKATTAQQLAILSEYSITSSSFANALGALRSAGFVEGKRDDLIATGAGIKEAGNVPPLPSGRALVEHWCANLGRAEATMLTTLVAHYPKGLDRGALSAATGYSVTSSSFANAIGKLRTLQLVDPGWPARAAAAFFEGMTS